jgi:hypothetical protein
MNCNMKTMFKWALGLLAIGAIASAALPQFRTWILTSGPTLLFLLCPLHMIYCVLTMKNKECDKSAQDTKTLHEASNTERAEVLPAEIPRG